MESTQRFSASSKTPRAATAAASPRCSRSSTPSTVSQSPPLSLARIRSAMALRVEASLAPAARAALKASLSPCGPKATMITS